LKCLGLRHFNSKCLLLHSTSSFDSTTGWLLYLQGSFLMQYMAVRHSLFYYVLLVVVIVILISKFFLVIDLVMVIFSGYFSYSYSKILENILVLVLVLLKTQNLLVLFTHMNIFYCSSCV